MDLRQLTYFAAVVDRGTVTAAAESLHISQPPVSAQLKLLEEELGCTLFDRSTRRMRLTEAGRTLYERACGILDLVHSAENEMADLKSGTSGTLRLGAASSICAALLPEWLSGEEPGLKFEVYEANTYQLLEQVRAGQIELALVRTPFSTPDLACIHLRQEPLCAVGGTLPVGGDELTALAAAPLIIYRRWEQVLARVFAAAELRPKILCVTDDARTVLSLALAGRGVGIVPESTLPDTLPRRELTHPAFQTEICAVTRRDGYLSPASRRFLEHLRAAWADPS